MIRVRIRVHENAVDLCRLTLTRKLLSSFRGKQDSGLFNLFQPHAFHGVAARTAGMPHTSGVLGVQNGQRIGRFPRPVHWRRTRLIFSGSFDKSNRSLLGNSLQARCPFGPPMLPIAFLKKRQGQRLFSRLRSLAAGPFRRCALMASSRRSFPNWRLSDDPQGSRQCRKNHCL
jgi:hypothetical protein